MISDQKTLDRVCREWFGESTAPIFDFEQMVFIVYTNDKEKNAQFELCRDSAEGTWKVLGRDPHGKYPHCYLTEGFSFVIVNYMTISEVPEQ